MNATTFHGCVSRSPPPPREEKHSGKSETTRSTGKLCNGSADIRAFLSTINLWQCPEEIFLTEAFYTRSDYYTQTGIRGIKYIQGYALQYPPPFLWATVTGVKHSELAVLRIRMSTGDDAIAASSLPRISRTFFFLDDQLRCPLFSYHLAYAHGLLCWRWEPANPSNIPAISACRSGVSHCSVPPTRLSLLKPVKNTDGQGKA